MSADSPKSKWDQRFAHLLATDDQFAAARRDESVYAEITSRTYRLPEILRTILGAYAERPALGTREVEYTTDPGTGRATLSHLPRFRTITYAELLDGAEAVTTTLTRWRQVSLRPGDRICVLGFTSVDYTVVDLAAQMADAVAVPLHVGAPAAQLRPIVEETEPTVIAVSADHLADAAELVEAHPPALLLVFDHHPEVDDQREALERVRERLSGHTSVAVATLPEVIARAPEQPAVPLPDSGDAERLALIMYTSGSTGTPKGAMYSERMLTNVWQRVPRAAAPSIILSFMPMSHMFGRATLYMALAQGGTAYFAARSDMSTLLDDMALVRPTLLNLVPRIWELLFQEFRARVTRHASDGADLREVEAAVQAEMRAEVLGGRFVAASTGSAPIAPELREWVESLVEMPLREAYGATEVRAIMLNGRIQRPPVTDYKLVDVTELGYFSTDLPYPRGELYVKSVDAAAGYYKRPELTAQFFDEEGWYHTGDILAEIGPDRLQYVDRRNNVIKLSQGEFVAISKLEAVFGGSPLVHQIYVYANSARSYPLAVVVPTEDALREHDTDTIAPILLESLDLVGRVAKLQSYEIPRDILVETESFTMQNGLLTGIGKQARPKLEERYAPALERLYTDLAERQENELAGLRRTGADRPVLETIGRAAGALLGAAAEAVRVGVRFADLGGDSLSALTFANVLQDIYDVEVPVDLIVSPAKDLQAIADYIAAHRGACDERPTFASVHGSGATSVHARDLALGAFIDEPTLAAARSLPDPAAEIRTVLLTGATGFLGRYLVLEWLERLNTVGGQLICLVRAKSDAVARDRLDATFDTGGAELPARYRELAAEHLEVLAGDKGDADLGLDPETWQRLADTVDVIVDSAALVNHVLPYRQLFGPNVVGSAELIRLAITTRIKPYAYVSTIAVGAQISPRKFTEGADIRTISPSRVVDDSYANGYGISKWASEVLLREANDLCGLPVTVFRSNMILAEPARAGQLNITDMFTRMILSLVATGIAPESFYQLATDGSRQPAHYDGLTVDFVAEAITTLGARARGEFETYHVTNPHDDGIGLDQYVDWLVDAGGTIRRVADHRDWVQRFETALRALPERQRQNSLLPLLRAFEAPLPPTRGSTTSTERFEEAVRRAKIGNEGQIPQITALVIAKYVADLRLLELLPPADAEPVRK
ncbi:thioester reductase domain-containing protein [Nocardia sp. NBC_00881]|uniref:carboxylic acid reductase n=1 Tax=Nocardia sp. NBC_00881 TaxID=2975995 RepID=UPI003866A20E|nr:thioester reductase domain-containing protein [Nocardia sp. NBC_00881]